MPVPRSFWNGIVDKLAGRYKSNDISRLKIAYPALDEPKAARSADGPRSEIIYRRIT